MSSKVGLQQTNRFASQSCVVGPQPRLSGSLLLTRWPWSVAQLLSPVKHTATGCTVVREVLAPGETLSCRVWCVEARDASRSEESLWQTVDRGSYSRREQK